ncbi:hypothetical protein FQZ97_862790 [compost metagenome]
MGFAEIIRHVVERRPDLAVALGAIFPKAKRYFVFEIRVANVLRNGTHCLRQGGGGRRGSPGVVSALVGSGGRERGQIVIAKTVQVAACAAANGQVIAGVFLYDRKETEIGKQPHVHARP